VARKKKKVKKHIKEKTGGDWFPYCLKKFTKKTLPGIESRWVMGGWRQKMVAQNWEKTGDRLPQRKGGRPSKNAARGESKWF